MNYSNKEQVSTRMDYKFLLLIVSLAIANYIYTAYFFQDTEEIQFWDLTYGISSLASCISALIIAKRYWGSEVFGKAYTALGIGFFFLFVGDLTYNYYQFVLNEDPYPSLADAFFLTFPVFAMFHLVINIRFFKRNIGIPRKILVSSIPLVITLSYAYFSLQDFGEANFDFYFGLVFVASSSLILSHAILGATVFRDSFLGTAWLLLACGILIFTIADVWYYYVELFEEYDMSHPTNTLWVMSNLVIIYALYKHKKAV